MLKACQPAISILLAILTSGFALQATAKAAENEELEEVVVTGTLIRGAAPTGSNVISITSEDVSATGASTTNQMLATIPQITNMFNALPQVQALGTTGTPTGVNLQVIRPNLRNTPSPATATGASTLILVDGHRLVNVGIRQSAPDPEAVPPGAIERIEIVTDGGSSTYGSDAIGGVINYITRRSFDGIQADARQGWADNYKTFDTNVTAGTKLGGGSIYASFNYAKHDDILGRDRSYVQQKDWVTGLSTGRACDVGNVRVGTTNYALPGLLPNTTNTCDIYQDADIYPAESRHSLFMGFSQDFGDAVKFDLRGFYTNRTSIGNGGPLRNGATPVNMRAFNPATPATNAFYYQHVAGANANAAQQVLFSFAPVLGNSGAVTTNKFDEWGVTPTITVDFNKNWQLRGMVNVGQSKATYQLPNYNGALLDQYANGTTAATAINVYNLAATSNKALINEVANYENAGEGRDKIVNVRAIVDGALFSLPGGKLRVAVGAESFKDDYKNRFVSNASAGGGPPGLINSLPFTSYSRTVKSVFGELQVPIVGADNRMRGIYAIDLSLAGRYDKYSDFGNTTNPKFGLSYQPVDWITLRGNWGKSFNAPTAIDQLASKNNSINAFPGSLAIPPGAPPFVFGQDYTVVLPDGADTNLRPQTAKTYSIGIDIAPPVVPGLRTSLSYYNIDYKGFLGKPPFFTDAGAFFAYYPQYGILFPTIAQLQAKAAQANVIDPSYTALLANLQSANPTFRVYELIDFRTFNLGNSKLSGMDFSVSYTHPTSFGSVDTRVSANRQVTHYSQGSSLAPFIDDLLYAPIFSMSASVGATIGKLRALASMNYSGGNNVQRTAAVPQDHVSSFTVANLFFRYDVNGKGMWDNLSLNLNVNNVLDQAPPVFRSSGNLGFANGQTVGRLTQVGVSKKF